MLPEEEFAAREARLAKEVFLLGEQNARLEDQVHSLSRENRNQIELLRRMKHEHEAEVGSVIRQHQVRVSRVIVCAHHVTVITVQLALFVVQKLSLPSFEFLAVSHCTQTSA